VLTGQVSLGLVLTQSLNLTGPLGENFLHPLLANRPVEIHWCSPFNLRSGLRGGWGDSWVNHKDHKLVAHIFHGQWRQGWRHYLHAALWLGATDFIRGQWSWIILVVRGMGWDY